MHVTKNIASGLRRMYTKRDSDFKNRIFISALFSNNSLVFIHLPLRRSLFILRVFEATQTDRKLLITISNLRIDLPKPSSQRFNKLMIHTRKINKSIGARWCVYIIVHWLNTYDIYMYIHVCRDMLLVHCRRVCHLTENKTEPQVSSANPHIS